MMAEKAGKTVMAEKVIHSKSTAETGKLYDNWAKTYEDDLIKRKRTGPHHLAEIVAKIVSDLDSKILDLGAGTGRIGELLAKHSFKVNVRE